MSHGCRWRGVVVTAGGAGGAGGGVLLLHVTDTLHVEGSIEVNGDPGSLGVAGCGGGSGGSLFVRAKNIRGAGSMEADGGHAVQPYDHTTTTNQGVVIVHSDNTRDRFRTGGAGAGGRGESEEGAGRFTRGAGHG